MSALDLEGAVAVVTGAGRGIGRAIAMRLAAHGARVVLAARSPAELAEVEQAIEAAGGEALAVPADITDEQEVERVLETARRAFGPLEILVCNAGAAGPIGRIVDVSPEEWRSTLETNLTAVFLCCRAAIPELVRSGRGKIVIVASGVALRPAPRIGAYDASKAGVTNFAEYLAEELDEHGVDVNAIRPGVVDTRLSRTHLDSGPERGGLLVEHVTRGLEGGGTPPEKAADLVLYLASRSGDGISGVGLIGVDDDVRSLPRRTRATTARADA
jgi:NAD(P)-dependent dehydrogenase (short-subunit alcohol dehydrogenase family)